MNQSGLVRSADRDAQLDRLLVPAGMIMVAVRRQEVLAELDALLLCRSLKLGRVKRVDDRGRLSLWDSNSGERPARISTLTRKAHLLVDDEVLVVVALWNQVPMTEVGKRVSRTSLRAAHEPVTHTAGHGDDTHIESTQQREPQETGERGIAAGRKRARRTRSARSTGSGRSTGRAVRMWRWSESGGAEQRASG